MKCTLHSHYLSVYLTGKVVFKETVRLDKFWLKAVFRIRIRIRIRIHRIHVFLGLPDPDTDPLVRGMVPDPSIFIIDLQDANKKLI